MEKLKQECLDYLQTEQHRDPQVLYDQPQVYSPLLLEEKIRIVRSVQNGTTLFNPGLSWPQILKLKDDIRSSIEYGTFSLATEAFFKGLLRAAPDERRHVLLRAISDMEDLTFSIGYNNDQAPVDTFLNSLYADVARELRSGTVYNRSDMETLRAFATKYERELGEYTLPDERFRRDGPFGQVLNKRPRDELEQEITKRQRRKHQFGQEEGGRPERPLNKRGREHEIEREEQDGRRYDFALNFRPRPRVHRKVNGQPYHPFYD
jgi:hypothetical protein